MRHSSFLALFATLAFISFQAEAAEGRMFRYADCGPVQCLSSSPDAIAYVSQVLAFANNCVGGRLGKSMSGGFFENALPDSSGCLTTKNLPPNPNGGAGLAPKCCILPMEGRAGACHMTCALHESR